METPDPREPSAGEELTPEQTRLARRAQAAGDALRSLIRDVVEREFGRPRMGDAPVEMTLSLRVRPQEGYTLGFDPPLEQQVLDQFGDVIAERGIYQPGRVYCFRCGSSACGHGAPDAPTQVFRGYNSTGVPEWHEFSQALLERQDPRVDGLYRDPPQVAALVIPGRDLKSDQLASFGKASKAYALLGQVVAGHFSLDDRRGDSAARRFALTVHFVETRTGKGQVALHVNPIVCMPGRQTLSEAFAEGWGGWLQRALAAAERSLRTMEVQINAAGADRYRIARQVLGRLPGVMRRCAGSLDRGHRQVRRRTRHAEERRKQQRPVQLALRDAGEIPDDQLLYDDRSEAVVVPGRQGRLHIFNVDGKHMTSFVGKPGTVEQRLRSRRWRMLDSATARSFRLQLQATQTLDGIDEEASPLG